MAGCSVGTIYNLFTNKERLYIEVLQTIKDRFAERISEEERNFHDRESAIERLIQISIQHHEQNWFLFQFSVNQRESSAVEDAVPVEARELYRVYLDRIEEFIQRSILPPIDDKELSWNLTLCLEGYIQTYLRSLRVSKKMKTTGQIVKFIKQLIVSLVQENQKTKMDNKIAESKQIYITRYDLVRLNDLIEVYRSLNKRHYESYLISLSEGLAQAKVVGSTEIPPDVVTMNSRIKIVEWETGKTEAYTLVFPSDTYKGDAISILDPLGIAMLGHRIGDSFELTSTTGTKTYRIEDLLYQPEAAGDFHL